MAVLVLPPFYYTPDSTEISAGRFWVTLLADATVDGVPLYSSSLSVESLGYEWVTDPCVEAMAAASEVYDTVIFSDIGADPPPINCCGEQHLQYTVTLTDGTVGTGHAYFTFPPCEGDTAECCSPYDPEVPPTLSAQTCVVETPKQRVHLSGTYVLHVQQNSDARCIKVRVNRIVQCMSGCELDELAYCWPQGCGVALLPAGTYDIYIPAQGAYPLEEGTGLAVTVLLEPVGADFVQALIALNGGSSGCCN